MFLVEKMRKAFPGQIIFFKSISGITYTEAKPDWSSFIKQRLRWAGKNKGLHNPVISFIWNYVGFYHIAMIFTLLLGFIIPVSLIAFGILIFIKWLSDYIIVSASVRFFKSSLTFADFILGQLLYPVYVLRLGWYMLLGKKGDWS
jgi:hypothetical protein